MFKMNITLELKEWSKIYTDTTGSLYGTDQIIVDENKTLISLLTQSISQFEKRALRSICKKIEPELLALKETVDSLKLDDSKSIEEKSIDFEKLISVPVTLEIEKIKIMDYTILHKLSSKQDYSFILEHLYE